jgi:hypothetical protein
MLKYGFLFMQKPLFSRGKKTTILNWIMNVLFFSPLALYSPHLETEIELALLELANGNRVSWVTCPGALNYVCHERLRSFASCIGCNNRKMETKSILCGVDFLELKLAEVSHQVPLFLSTKEVKAFYYRGVDVGSCVLSTIISLKREPNLNLSEYGELVRKCCAEVMRLTDALYEMLLNSSYEKVYVFNGRMMFFRPIVRVLQILGIDFFVHERAGKIDRYSLTQGTYPHDLRYKKLEIKQIVEKLSDENLVSLGDEWFKARRSGSPQGWPSFILNQTRGYLHPRITPGKRIVSIYVSSEDEFVCFDDWENWIYKSQEDGIARILDDLPEKFLLVIRIHPNLKDLDNTQTRGLTKFEKHPKCIVIRAEDIFDSYALLEASEKVITFGSTVGIEAVYWGKPSILAGGRSFYEDLGAVYRPVSHEEVMNLILAPNLQPKEKILALKYGAWESSYGFKFIHFEPIGFFSGKIQGKYINYGLLYKIVLKFEQILKKFSPVLYKKIWNK